MSQFEEFYGARDFKFDLHFEEDSNETFRFEVITDVKRGIGQMFYIVDREEMTFQKPEDVPNIFYQRHLMYYFALLFRYLNHRRTSLYLEYRPYSQLLNTHQPTSVRGERLVFRGAENWAYIYIHQHFRLLEMSWDSAWTWYLAIIGVDFCYYWVHRACHEVHLLWAQHQVHHSSEEYNLAVGLRQSVLQGWCGFVNILSTLALVIPPAQFLTHQQFNLLYQFWIHTQAINTLGPLEWILNTPKHHRVHHGCNLYCLDKNYGGFLIIWDRIFGTFAEERNGENIVYGLVYNQPSFNPVFLQLFYNQNVINKWKAMHTWEDKVAAIWKGPSWQPGKPRLGAEEDKLDIKSREKYDVKLPMWCNLYLCLHFAVVVFGFQELALQYTGMNALAVFGFVIYIIISLTAIGMLFDNRRHASIFELARCLLFVFYVQRSGLLKEETSISLIQSFFVFSSCFWILKTFKILQITAKNK
ncbi:hypothetical protein L9F63_005553 [Diploptera punctata]|uniref:Alkylglycerol monooxygenase n=1 Tax=Diploptera punctata TaxID=6984 RepID=A0AAD7ZCW3_DIPPU|nr:hypothetical protein L9F63_005553 [Diploptera punctata]